MMSMTNELLDADAPELLALVEHLAALQEVASQVVERVQLLNACRFAPVDVVDAAVHDLTTSVAEMQELEERRTQLVAAVARRMGAGEAVTLGELEQFMPLGMAARVTTLRLGIRRTMERLAEESGATSLELTRLLADVREVERVATGSPGTYDASGRTMIGNRRRQRGVV